MALLRIEPYIVDSIGNFVFNTATVTSNLSSGNANLGNLATANYFSGSGNNLSNIQAANITGIVANANVANTAYSVAVANVSGIGNIATINKDGNASNLLYGNGVFAAAPVSYSNSDVATYLASFGSNTITTTGNISVGNITATNLGNISSLNKDGNASNILYGNGVFASAPVTYGDSNVATYLPTYTGNLSPGNLTIAPANLKISGGTANYVLQTDGAGNLSWTAQSSGGGVGTLTTVDSFTGDGSNATFTLSTTPTDANYTIAVVHGMVQPKSAYSVTGNSLTFSSAPANTAVIEITTIASANGSGGGASNTSIRAQAMTMGIIFGG